MKRSLTYALALILLAGALVAGAVALSSRSKTDKQATTTATKVSNTAKSKGACDVLTLQDAKSLIGENAKGGPNGSAPETSDLTTTYCSYTASSTANANVSSNKTATIVITASKTDKGTASNQNQFSRLKPPGAQDVPGYGDAAYWDGEHGQLNILKSNNWYVLSVGPVEPADRTLDQAKQMADLIIARL